MRIDLNADVGESFGAWSLAGGADEELIPLVSSVNVACGVHAGDPATIDRTVRLAATLGVAIGAHPGYPDLPGFGRRDMALTPGDIETSVLYQIGALEGFVRSAGTALRHVKAHGALYNRAARDRATADAVARAIHRFDPSLVMVGLAGSVMLEAGRAAGLAVAAEAFADRGYEADGSLRGRQHADALIHEPALAAEQALRIVRDRAVPAVDGSVVRLDADTLCIHGDAAGAAARAAAVRDALERAGVTVGARLAPSAAR